MGERGRQGREARRQQLGQLQRPVAAVREGLAAQRAAEGSPQAAVVASGAIAESLPALGRLAVLVTFGLVRAQPAADAPGPVLVVGRRLVIRQSAPSRLAAPDGPVLVVERSRTAAADPA